MAALNFNGTDLEVRVPRGKNAELKELGARWDKKAECWTLAPTSLNVLRLEELYGSEVLEGAPEDVRDLAEQPWGFRGFTEDELSAAQDHPAWETLYNFQREGVEYLSCNPHAASLVGLSWGLGKGATAVVAADLISARRVLVLAPLTLAPAWKGEHSRWGQDPQGFHRATAQDPDPAPDGWTVTNHETIQEVVLRDEDGNVFQPDWVKNARKVKEWRDAGPVRENKKGKLEPVRERIVRTRRSYLEQEWDLIIVDESVLLKNRKAVKAEVLLRLRKAGDPFVWMLSASPTTKFNDDLHKQLEILFPRAFTSYWRTAEFLCNVSKGGWGWTIEGNRSDRDPQHYLKDLLWIKSEEDADVDLPEYHEQAITVEPTRAQRKALTQMLDEWIVELEESDQPVVAENWLARTTRLSQITSNLGSLPKPDGSGFFKRSSAKEDLLIDLIEQGDLQTPLLVWAWYKETAHSIGARIESKFKDLEVAVVTGSSSRQEKDERIQSYKDGEIDVLVLQMGVGKFGHTLTDTRSIFYHDRTFDSDAYTQSRRRVRRLGLKHRPVLVVAKVADSADDLIDANLEGKLRSIAKLTNMDLADLLRSIRED